MKPSTPASRQRREIGGVAGHDAAPETDIDVTAARGGATLGSKPATVVVAGMLFSGMSTSVVMPPAAAARVAVSNPSQSARPGSLMCTWRVDQARQHDGGPRIDLADAGRCLSAECRTPIADDPPVASMWIVAGRMPSGNTTRSLRIRLDAIRSHRVSAAW